MVPASEDWQKLKRVGVTGRAWGIQDGNGGKRQVLGTAKRQFLRGSRKILPHASIP